MRLSMYLEINIPKNIKDIKIKNNFWPTIVPVFKVNPTDLSIKPTLFN